MSNGCWCRRCSRTTWWLWITSHHTKRRACKRRSKRPTPRFASFHPTRGLQSYRVHVVESQATPSFCCRPNAGSSRERRGRRHAFGNARRLPRILRRMRIYRNTLTGNALVCVGCGGMTSSIGSDLDLHGQPPPGDPCATLVRSHVHY